MSYTLEGHTSLPEEENTFYSNDGKNVTFHRTGRKPPDYTMSHSSVKLKLSP